MTDFAKSVLFFDKGKPCKEVYGYDNQRTFQQGPFFLPEIKSFWPSDAYMRW